MGKLAKYNIFFYGLMGLPLGFLGLPLYIYIPKFYATNFDISLENIGLCVIFSRVLDTIQDPFIGWFFQKYADKRMLAIWICIPFLTLFWIALLNPQSYGTIYWFLISLMGVYFFYTVLIINYLTLAADLNIFHSGTITSLNGSREAFGLLGILCAAALPSILRNYYPDREVFQWIGYIFGGLILVSSLCLKRIQIPMHPGTRSFKFDWSFGLKNKPFRLLLVAFIFNTAAMGFSSSLVLFYIQDVLQEANHEGYFLAVYFLAGAAGTPLWVKLAQKFGKARAWRASILLSIVAFIVGYFLKSHDIIPFYLICLSTGFCLGADLALPPSLLVETIKDKGKSTFYFSLWQMISKLGIAVSSGFALLWLYGIGYRSGHMVHTIVEISFLYTFVPCMLKLLSFYTIGIFSKELT